MRRDAPKIDLGERIDAQATQLLPQIMDQVRGSIDGGLLTVLSELGTAERRIAFRDQLRHLHRRPINGRRREGRRRGLEESIHALRTRPSPVSAQEFLTQRLPGQYGVHRAHLLDHGAQLIVR